MDPFFIYLSESYKALDEIQPLTTNQILFEAEDNEKVAKISSKNEASKEKSDNMFMKALAKLRALIDKVIDSIKNFIDYMGLSKDQKALYKDFREKVKNNPEFRNKKVTVKVYEGIQESYGNALKNAEATYKNIKDEESGARNEEIAKTLDKAKENVNYVEKSVTLAALCKMIDQNEALARNIESAILIDRMTLNKLEQTYGKKGAKKIEDHIYVKTHKIGILKLGARGIIMKARQKEVEYVGDTLKELTKDIPSLLSAANAIDKDKTKALTRTVARTAMDVGGDSVAQGAGGPIKRFAKKQVTQKGPVGFVRRKYHEKFDRKENIVDEKKNFASLAKLAKESSYIDMVDPRECAENIPFHEYYISDYYSEALKDIDPQTKASMISMAAMITAMAGSIVIGRKLSASHKKKLQKMFKLYEQNHPDVIPASSFEYRLYSEDEASDMKVRTKYSTASMSTKYHIYTDKKNKPFMYIIFSFKRVGSVTYNRTDGGFSSGLVSTSRDEDVIHPECDLILVSPLAKKHPTYYRAYMAYKAGIGHDALNRFIDTMKTEVKKSKNTFKESAYDMILEDTEFDGFEEYLESTDDSLFFDEFYKEANEIV